MKPDAHRPCPRCGKSPVEVTTIDRAEPRHLPACPCYPHPPQCVTCGTAIEDGRCPNTGCHVFDVLQPAPIVDPLWEGVTHRPKDQPNP